MQEGLFRGGGGNSRFYGIFKQVEKSTVVTVLVIIKFAVTLASFDNLFVMCKIFVMILT